MSGDTTNVNIWAFAQVWVASLGTALPADVNAAFPAGWAEVGLLDGDQGFEEDRSEDVKKHFAWGNILCAITRSKFEHTKKFTVLEDNPTTRSLIWPGSTATSTIVPVPIDQLIAFVTTTGGKTRRKIASYKAQVDVDGKVSVNETDLASVDLIATIFPDPTTKEIYVEQGKPSIVSIALTPLTLALSLAGSFIKTVVATATYSDASTGNVSSSVTWSSSAPAKATVSAGYVTGLTTGTTNVSCSYGGVTSTAPCVVTVAA